MDQPITISTTNKETENQVIRLYFDPRKWSFNKSCTDNVGNRSFITGPDGVLAEGFMIGDWGNRWTEIVSETLLLPKNTDCSFTFWLNGGENDRNNEVCRFEIIFNNNYEQRFSYNLNRNYIRPAKKLNGWELYEIPFRTQDNEYTELRFVAQRAYMTVLAARDVSLYRDMEDHPDPFEAERPQRHNIIFSDGFPANNWYSTKGLREAHAFKAKALGVKQSPDFTPGVNMPEGRTAGANVTSQIADAVKQLFDQVKNSKYISVETLEGIVEGSCEQARRLMEDAIQKLGGELQQVTNEIQTSVGVRLSAISADLEALSSTCDMLEDIDMENLANNIRVNREETEDLDDILSDASDTISGIADELRCDIEEIMDRLEELRDSLSM